MVSSLDVLTLLHALRHAVPHRRAFADVFLEAKQTISSAETADRSAAAGNRHEKVTESRNARHNEPPPGDRRISRM